MVRVATLRQRVKGGSQTSLTGRKALTSTHSVKDADIWRTTPKMGAVLQIWLNESHT